MSDAAPVLPLIVEGSPGELDKLNCLLLAGISSENSRRAYARAVSDFLAWYRQEPRGTLSKLLVEEYRTELERKRLWRRPSMFA